MIDVKRMIHNDIIKKNGGHVLGIEHIPTDKSHTVGIEHTKIASYASLRSHLRKKNEMIKTLLLMCIVLSMCLCASLLYSVHLRDSITMHNYNDHVEKNEGKGEYMYGY